MKSKVLILGNSAKEYALAKKLSDSDYEIYVAPGNDGIKEFATTVDIRDNSEKELLEYVMENGIEFTIPSSLSSQKSDIYNLFNKHGQQVFAPSVDCINMLTDKAFAKKLLYRLKIPTPKFGIFEKQSMVSDYIKNLNNPYVIKTNFPSSAVAFVSPNDSKNVLESIFTEKSPKVVIEDYVWGTPFAFYTVTDGYKALPIGSSIIYKHSLEGNGGQLTSGMGSCVPNYKLSFDNEDFLMNNVIYPTLAYLENENTPYTGILGVNGILNEHGEVTILGYQTFMQDSDSAGVLETIDGDILEIFKACTIGSFSDDYDFIPQKNTSAVTVVLNCKNSDNKENPIDNIDELSEETILSFYNNVTKNIYMEYEAKNGPVFAVTALGSSPSIAREKLYDEVTLLNFKGISYRKDICKINNSEFEDYLKIS